MLVAVLVLAAGAAIPFSPLYHVPWLLVALVGFVLWRRLAGRPHWHPVHEAGRPSSFQDR